ncbi:MAG TPA: class I SAM-dependent methyltransferase [Bryobacterales bacterium]|jgi:SAM-dependent methyltransferase|nr:class I SAM-dependent methyltransferase [Bryobacterales bacterium]
MKTLLTMRARVLALALITALPGANTGCNSLKSVQAQPAKNKETLDLGKVTRKRQIAPVCSDAEWLTRPERDATEQPEKVLDALEIPEGATVADVGAGVGYFTWRLARRVGPKGKVIAEDVQQHMLDLLAENLKQRRITNVEMVLGGVRDPHLPENAVDLALLVDVYHEFAEPEAMIHHIRQALKPDGRLVLVEYRKEDPSIPILPLHKMTVEEVRSEIEPLGFQLQKTLEFLPTQHIIIFTKKPLPSEERAAASR